MGYRDWKRRRDERLIGADLETLDQVVADLEAIRLVLADTKDTITKATQEEE